MTLSVCLKCTAAYSVGAPCCPQCGSKRAVEQGSKGDPALTAEVALPAADTTDTEAPNVS